MTLYEKIKQLRPTLQDSDFIEIIMLQNDGNGKGDYIKEWNHPTETRPTDEELENA